MKTGTVLNKDVEVNELASARQCQKNIHKQNKRVGNESALGKVRRGIAQLKTKEDKN